MPNKGEGRTCGSATRAPEETNMSKNWAPQSMGRMSHAFKRSMRSVWAGVSVRPSDLVGVDTTRESMFFSRSTWLGYALLTTVGQVDSVIVGVCDMLIIPRGVFECQRELEVTMMHVFNEDRRVEVCQVSCT